MSRPQLFRAVVPVDDIEAAVAFYRRLLGVDPELVGPGRVYFPCGGTTLVCYDAQVEHGDARPAANGGHLYFAVDELERYFARAGQAGCAWLEPEPARRAWGERSFYARDPFGNPICFVERATAYTAGAPPLERATAKKRYARMPGIAQKASAASRRDVRPEEDP